MMMKWGPRVALILMLCALAAVPASAQGGEHRAALIVRFGDGQIQTRCVAFPEESISGQQLLERAGLKTIVNPASSIGGAVCSIEGQGCGYPAQDCFCKCTGPQCEYWAYYHLVSGAWQYSQMGAAGYQVSDGAVEGWSWGQGDFSQGTEPPKIAFADVCSAGAVATGQAQPARPADANPTRYLPFGVALAVLAVAAVVVLRRRSTGSGNEFTGTG